MNSGTNNIKQTNILFYHYITVKLRDDFVSPGTNDNGNKGPFTKNDTPPWRNILPQFPNLYIGKLFTSLPAKKISDLIKKASQCDPLYKPVNLLAYYGIFCPKETNPDELVKTLLKSDWVEEAYIQGKRSNPSVDAEAKRIITLQEYLNPAPEGINAKYAWNIDRGKANVKFIDIEQGWRLDNKCFNVKTLPLTGINQMAYWDHGTAVLEVIMGKRNKESSGIALNADSYIMSQWRPNGFPNEADAILSAISYLNFGDIILLELQSCYPDSKDKLWPVEIYDINFQVIRLATALGIIVIEAGGNGDLYSRTGNDLDLFAVSKKRILYPRSKDFKDSGAIMVAASCIDPPHIWMQGSNYGSRINCYASGKPSEKLTGTSGASAIIAGAAIAIQSISEAKNNIRLSPKQMRAVFSSSLYGTVSRYGHKNDKIGVMPDLKKIIERYLNICTVKSETSNSGKN